MLITSFCLLVRHPTRVLHSAKHYLKVWSDQAELQLLTPIIMSSTTADLLLATRLELYARRVRYSPNAVLQYHRGSNSLRGWHW
jgi:hypothetical protein